MAARAPAAAGSGVQPERVLVTGWPWATDIAALVRVSGPLPEAHAAPITDRTPLAGEVSNETDAYP